MIRILKATICTAMIAALSTPAIADKPFEDEIKARQGYYKLLKYNFGILGAMVKGKKDYDADLANTAAQNIFSLSQVNNSFLWPKGSDNANVEDTRAKPEIWENFDDIGEKSGNWKAAVDTLSGNAGNGLDALKKSFGPVGKACKACHDDYKAK